MAYKILTVSREFGSGGHTVAQKVAEELGIAFYDKQIVDKIALETGFSPEFIAEESEYARNRSFLAYAFSSHTHTGIMGGMTPADYLWTIQRKVILEIAEKEPCVIIGRCADHILKDRKDCLHVFIHADKQFRAERIVRLYGSTDKDPIKRLDEKDGKRLTHYRHFTDKTWGMSKNYNLSLDTSAVGIDGAVRIITQVMREEK